jgi:hypothetical protein
MPASSEVNWRQFSVLLPVRLNGSLDTNLTEDSTFRKKVEEMCDTLTEVFPVKTEAGLITEPLTMSKRVFVEVLSSIFFIIGKKINFCESDVIKKEVQYRLFSILSNQAKNIGWSAWDYFVEEHQNLFILYPDAVKDFSEDQEIINGVSSQAVFDCLMFLFDNDVDELEAVISDPSEESMVLNTFLQELGILFSSEVLTFFSNSIDVALFNCKIKPN